MDSRFRGNDRVRRLTHLLSPVICVPRQSPPYCIIWPAGEPTFFVIFWQFLVLSSSVPAAAGRVNKGTADTPKSPSVHAPGIHTVACVVNRP